MDKRKILAACSIDEMRKAMLEMNEETERLKKFAKNVNAFGSKIYPSLVTISEDPK